MALSAERRRRMTVAAVWVLRVAVGLCFITSGLAKSIDPWGFIFKIEEYLHAFGITQPRSLVLVASVALSATEFVAGVMLAVGSYKRTVVWLMLAMMAVMLPLTAYIYVAAPVADCGCFGDFLHLSNGVTFAKNIVLTAALVWLAVYNRRVAGLYGAYIQWLTVVCTAAYAVIVAVWGYGIQPMVDFRSFAAGRNLAADADAAADASEALAALRFVYEKDGRRQEFTADNLPDSTWTFVERVSLRRDGASTGATDFTVLEGDEDVSADVVSPTGLQVLALVPEYDRADVAYTYLLNEVSGCMQRSGASMAALVAASGEQLEEWTDISMADYPVYGAEPTMLKEMARGQMALVGLRDGVIEWKRSAASIDPEMFATRPDGTAMSADEAFATLADDGPRMLRRITLVLVSVLAVLFLLDRSGRLLRWRSQVRKRRRLLMGRLENYRAKK